MSLSNHNHLPTPNLTGASALSVPVPGSARSQQQSQPPSARELRRFQERRLAQELGYEMPLNTEEAASYVGYHEIHAQLESEIGESTQSQEMRIQITQSCA